MADARLTLAERWLRFAIRMIEPDGLGSNIFIAITGAIAAFQVIKGHFEMAAVFALLAALHWERIGAVRLLARKDAELRSARPTPLGL